MPTVARLSVACDPTLSGDGLHNTCPLHNIVLITFESELNIATLDREISDSIIQALFYALIFQTNSRKIRTGRMSTMQPLPEGLTVCRTQCA